MYFITEIASKSVYYDLDTAVLCMLNMLQMTM